MNIDYTKALLTSSLCLNWPARIVLVRHGESEGNKHGRVHMAKVQKKPTHQYALTQTGIIQARKAGEYIEHEYGAHTFDAYFTSMYARAQQTFAAMFEGRVKHGHQIIPLLDARLNEIHRGIPSVLGADELSQAYPHDVMMYGLHGWFFNIPLGGQSCIQIDHVIHSFLAFLRESCAGKRVIIVGHGTWINLCCRILLNRTPEESERLHKEKFFENAGITVFEKDEASGHMVLKAENIVPYGPELKTIAFE